MVDASRNPVVAGFDLSEASRQAVHWAAHEASSRRRPLVLVHVLAWPFQHDVPIRVPGEGDVTEVLQRVLRQELDALEESCGTIDAALEVEKRMPLGDPAQALGELLADAELLVLGGPQIGARTDPLGATAAEVLTKRGRAPIVVVRGDRGEPGNSPVVVGVDGSRNSQLAVGFAYEFAARHGSRLVAVHSWSDVGLNPFDGVGEWEVSWTEMRDKAEAVLSEALAGWHEHHPDVAVHHVVTADGPARALLEEGRGASLLVVGSHGRGVVRRALLGSVSHPVVNRATCPVAVLPSR